MDILQNYLHKQKVWSEMTFGPGKRTEGICKHIAKELEEMGIRERAEEVSWTI